MTCGECSIVVVCGGGGETLKPERELEPLAAVTSSAAAEEPTQFLEEADPSKRDGGR